MTKPSRKFKWFWLLHDDPLLAGAVWAVEIQLWIFPEVTGTAFIAFMTWPWLAGGFLNLYRRLKYHDDVNPPAWFTRLWVVIAVMGMVTGPLYYLRITRHI